MNYKYSQEVQVEALKVAKATQKPKQTKEQTKLIAQGIEKGIAEYKKQQSKKSRESDKAKKALLKERKNLETKSDTHTENTTAKVSNSPSLPWLLLAVSWLGFLIYIKIV
jgi:hypothetical protein